MPPHQVVGYSMGFKPICEHNGNKPSVIPAVVYIGMKFQLSFISISAKDESLMKLCCLQTPVDYCFFLSL